MSDRAFRYGEKVRYKNTGMAGIVCLCTARSVLIQTAAKEFWVGYDEIDIAGDPNHMDFKCISIPPAEVVLEIQGHVDHVIRDLGSKYGITAKDRVKSKDVLMGSILRKKLLQARDGLFNGKELY